MASIDQIQALLTNENKKLKEDLGKEIMQSVGKLIDQKLEAHEEKVMREIRALQARTETLEKGGIGDQAQAAGPAAAKRARSEPRTVSQKHELKPLVVLTGFPFNSRKQELEGFIRTQLDQREEWKHLIAFAPGVRASAVMIKVKSKDEMFDFIQKWKDLDISFKEKPIRARADKTPEQRMGNSRIYRMNEYLKGVFTDKDVDPDFKRSSVWIGDGEVVKWDPQADMFKWEEETLTEAGIEIDRAEAEKFASTRA